MAITLTRWRKGLVVVVVVVLVVVLAVVLGLIMRYALAVGQQDICPR